MKRLLLLLPLMIFFAVTEVSAQFSISQKKTESAKLDTLRANIASEFAIEDRSPAYKRYQRQQIFQTRNYFQTKNTLTFSQYAFENWVSGSNYFNGRLTSYNQHVYQKDKFVLDSYLNISYGIAQSDGVMSKNEDVLQLKSEGSYVLYNRWSYTLGANLATQVTKTYSDYSTKEAYSSKFFAPATLTPYIGLTYKVDNNRKITFAPISGSLLMVLDDSLSNAGTNGIDAGKKVQLSGGAYVTINWQEKIIKDQVTYKAYVQSFWDYKNTPNLNWENYIDFSVLKYFTVSFHLRAIYDKSITVSTTNDDGETVYSDSHWQFKQTLGFGISYTFTNKTKPTYTIIK